ncbi:hypothetical protein KL930_002151 [Ogataea haglerorum]|uniref:F-box domain-containing protein n=1 Tax=Ogataea haglerorum TaxID=1937702 RepID=A0ABQ7RLJ0_9ASCO|nr:hypothetical protein KL951_000780 [Ogataea haglerorum]KAG7710104.1 hypothetical protein KL914_001014 [Ogataea haglerorum]KAG7711115.1 hypothetical protein KL950_001081 [Ogataea haglerorum]KAG7733880.1 hypothetical protein KL948_001082 [Ogataea haglerorum]KAG7740933.1 hypothetical protein KL923_001574 [Ogataea haglerorum]
MISRDVKRRKTESSTYPLFLLNLPLELIRCMQLSREDLVNISTLDSAHRAKFYPLVYERLKLTWRDFKSFSESFKSKDLVRAIRIFSDLQDRKSTTYGEWNISLKGILEESPNLKELVIEVMSSARCLKYQDNFDTNLSDKIEKLKLISHSGAPNDESLFELTQLQRFHNIKQLTLNGFLLAKDQYFYPKFKSDFSDLKERSRDGRLVFLNDLTLINCKWDHPYSLSDVFSPVYPSPNPLLKLESNEFTSPERLSLFYSKNSSSFVAAERFRSFIDNDANELFLFETRFYNNLKHLSIVVLSEDYNENKYNYYYPWLNWLNLKKIFQTQNEETREIENKSILTNLESLTLVGWRMATLSELRNVFGIGKELKYNMKHLALYLVRPVPHFQEVSEKDKLELRKVEEYLQMIFNNGQNKHTCTFEVGYVEDCFADERYVKEYTKNNE